ncbi:MAG: methyltransferase domain-containing protein, partial [Candidatus Peribacteria bacterium]|nr:methyltransferase domain-containing protein [Candidatus Peribacteria bacterium]
SAKANQIFETLKKLCFESGLPVYDQKTHQGFFRHLVIREGVNMGQLMVNLSVCLANLNTEQTKVWEKLLEKMEADSDLKSQISTFVITYNEGLADTVKNEKSETKTFRDDDFIHEKLLFDEGDITFRISPFSFFQTNTLGAQKLFGTAFKMLGNVEGNILDLYCGAGSIGLSLLRLSNSGSPLSREMAKPEGLRQLIGIEIVEDAIVDAQENAKINGLENQSFFVASPAEKALENFPELEEKIKNLGVVVIDPPRDGLHKNVIEWIADLKKTSDFKLLYISCNPVTMARDVELFLEKGFKLKEVQPLDMFPHTQHCECIGVLS